MSVNEIIKKLRAERELTQNDLAKMMNCNRQKIADWERGKSTPSAEDLILLSKKFNVSTDYLLGISDVPTTDKDLQFICDYTGLNEDSIKNLYFGTEREENNSVNFLLSKQYINGFYDFCICLEDLKNQYIEFLRYKEKIVNDKTSFPKNLDEAFDIVDKYEQLNEERDFRDFKLQKAFKKIVNSYCEDEINEDNEIDEDFQKFIKYYLFSYEDDFSPSPEKAEQAFYLLKKSTTHKVNIPDLLKGGDTDVNNP